MTPQTRPQTAEIEYVRAPWRLRLRWWLVARLWCWSQSFEGISADLLNPLWRR
jgi:hypothetical protein